MSFQFGLFYVCRLCLYLLFFKIYFLFLVARGIKPDDYLFSGLIKLPDSG